MRKKTPAVPSHLRNGSVLPKSFSEISEHFSSTPKYRITIYSIDKYANKYRLIYIYYILLLAQDPSRLQDLMKTRSRSPTSGFEDGKVIRDIMAYNEYLPITSMQEFRKNLVQLIDENSQSYAMFDFYNTV